MRNLLLLLASFVCAAAAQDEPLQIVKRAIQKDGSFLDAARNYAYYQRRVVTEFDKNGGSKTTKDETNEIVSLYGRPYSRLLKKDGQDLSSRDASREENKLNKELNRRKKEEDKAAQREEREAEERQRATQELSAAFDFRHAGVEPVAGRAAWVISATPKAGFQPQTRQGKLYPKMSGKLWIDQAESRLVKVEAHVNQAISFGGFLLKLYPGAVFEHERIRLDNETWLPMRDIARGEAKIAGIKLVRARVETTYSNYRRFQSESKVVPVAN